MANTLNIIRDHARIAVTPRDVGLTLTVEVTAYDSGVINVNGLPSLDYASTVRVRPTSRGVTAMRAWSRMVFRVLAIQSVSYVRPST